MFRIRGRNQKVCVRDARPKDAESIIGIGAEAFPYIREPHSFFRDRIQKAKVFVAETNGKVIGFLDVEVYGERAHIAGIAVHRKYRGRGVGAFLLRTCLDYLERIGVHYVTLLARDSNKAAVRLYRGAGFRPLYYVQGDIRVWYLHIPSRLKG